MSGQGSELPSDHGELTHRPDDPLQFLQGSSRGWGKGGHKLLLVSRKITGIVAHP